ncbi:MAG: hypothetical protein ABW101_04975 [Candidatus Thiodiazotropha sp.]
MLKTFPEPDIPAMEPKGSFRLVLVVLYSLTAPGCRHGALIDFIYCHCRSRFGLPGSLASLDVTGPWRRLDDRPDPIRPK